MRIAYFFNSYPTETHLTAEDEILALMALGHEIYIVSVWGQRGPDSKIPPQLRDRVVRIQGGLTVSLLPAFRKVVIRFPLKSLRKLPLPRESST